MFKRFKRAFSKGKWWVSGTEVGADPLMEVKVAQVSGANWREAKANGRLIAASPKMFDALQAILIQVQQGKVLERDACITMAREAMEAAADMED